MKISRVATTTAVYETMRKLGRDAMVRKEWAAAECYGLSFMRLAREVGNETIRTVHGNGGEDRA